MRLIITRHGETEENVNGILQGHQPGKLNEKGILQAKKLAEKLKNEDIVAIYSSDLARAFDTAKEIQQVHPNARMILSEDLREKNQGNLTGKLIKEIDWSKPRDTEKRESMTERAKRILDLAYKEHKKDTVIFVSHGGLIQILMSILLKKSVEDIKKLGDISNTSILIFDIKDNEFTFINCDKSIE